MKKINIQALLIASSFIALDAYAVGHADDDIFAELNTSPRTHAQNGTGERSNESEYIFEVIGDIFKPAHQPYQAKFRITRKDEDWDSRVETLSLEKVKSKGFDINIPQEIDTLHPSDPLPKKWGKASEQLSLEFTFEHRKYRHKFTRPKEHLLHGNWEFTDNRNNSQTEATLRLKSLLNGQQWRTVHERKISINHELIKTDAEISGQLYFDGDKIYQAKTKLLHYRDPRTDKRYARTVVNEDGEIPSHQGKQIIYVEPFALGDDPIQPREAYRGSYDLIESIDGDESIPGRGQGRLIYTDGTHYYLPDVTQEVWVRDQSRVGFFIASYKKENQLSFVSDALIGNAGKLLEGLYLLEDIEMKDNKRIEKWKRLGEESKEVRVTSKEGIPSIPGMASTAPYLVCDDGADEIVRNLSKGINEISKRIQTNKEEQGKDVTSIIVLGKSGRGKSTFLHALAGIPLLARVDGRIEPTETLPGFVVGHGYSAGTGLPSIFHEPIKNVNLIDCPGFEDPGDAEDDGAKQDLLNGYSIKEVFTDSKAKVLLTASTVDLDKSIRAKPFLDLLDNLTKLFPDDHQLKEATYLVITNKGPGLTLLDKFREIMRDNPPQFQRNKRAENLFRHIVTNRDTRVFEFPLPQGLGEYPFDREPIFEKLLRAPSVENPAFTLTFEANARELAGKLAKSLNDYLTTYMTTEGAQKVVNHCRKMIDDHQGSIKELRDQLTKVVEKLRKLQNNDVTTEKFSNKLAKFIDMGDINKVISHITFLKEKVKEDITPDTARWANSLNNTIRSIEKLATTPQPDYDDQSKSLTLKGALVGISDITTSLSSHSETKDIQVYGTNSLFIDNNVTCKEGFCTFIAPRWKVIAEPTVSFTVDLSGNDNATKAENGARAGTDGSPGAPGGNGGHFYGRGVSYSHLDQLTVNTSGGQGGEGGNGATGETGTNGLAGNVNALQSFNNVTTVGAPQSFTDRHPTGDFEVNPDDEGWKAGYGPWWVHAHMDGTETTYTHGNNNATAGGTGGNKGKGGKGGHHGSSIIDNADVTCWTHTSANGNPGDDGSAGAGGEGGLNGPIIEGTYISGMRGTYHHKWKSVGGLFGGTSHWECRKADHWLNIRTISNQTRASKGSEGQEVNETGIASPTDQPTAKKLSKHRTARLEEFTKFYYEQASDASTSVFVRVFPGLEK